MQILNYEFRKLLAGRQICIAKYIKWISFSIIDFENILIEKMIILVSKKRIYYLKLRFNLFLQFWKIMNWDFVLGPERILKVNRIWELLQKNIQCAPIFLLNVNEFQTYQSYSQMNTNLKILYFSKLIAVLIEK